MDFYDELYMDLCHVANRHLADLNEIDYAVHKHHVIESIAAFVAGYIISLSSPEHANKNCDVVLDAIKCNVKMQLKELLDE